MGLLTDLGASHGWYLGGGISGFCVGLVRRWVSAGSCGMVY